MTTLETAMLKRAVEEAERRLDPEMDLPVAHAPTSFYAYHTALRGVRVHPLREAFSCAGLLIETGDPARCDRAARMLRRALQAQDRDPQSRTYGIWPYYWEEPLGQMEAPDWNWADFCGSELLLIVYRHPERLAEDLREPVREAIRHAARSVQRRNMGPHYTNICALGTFVTLAAGRWLGEADLWGYGVDRLRRFAAHTDGTGSFNEYNSPTYAFVTMRALANILTYLDDPEVQRVAGGLHERVWLGLAYYFHAPTRQLAGPHSRSYSTDLHPYAKMALQVGTEGAVFYYTPEDAPGGAPFPARMRCPAHLLGHFRGLKAPVQRRELFIPARKHDDGREEAFVQGTTFLHPAFALGTVNRSDLWHQRRPFVGYWGDGRGGRSLQFRGLKNLYDFTSAHAVTVQEQGCALSAINYLTMAGDRHPSFDILRDGKFRATDLRVSLMLTGASGAADVRVNGEAAKAGDRFAAGDRVTVGLDRDGNSRAERDGQERLAGRTSTGASGGGALIGVCCPAGTFGGSKGYGEVRRDEEALWIDFVLWSGEERAWDWAEIGDAAAVLAVWMAGADEMAREAFDRAFQAQEIVARIEDGRIEGTWASPAGRLKVEAPSRPGDRVTQGSAFRLTIDGQDVPPTRITEERILG
jgi:hypothetical protein